MELMVKLNQDKCPRLGIVYPSEFQAGKAFEQIQQKYGNDVFKAFFELKKNNLQLTLMPAFGGGNIIYKELGFRAEQIKKFQAFVKPKTEIHLLHVFKKGNEAFVAKVGFKHPAPLIIKAYEINEISFAGF